jgi:carbamate kinase
MRILIALGGNALLRRGEALTAKNQITNIKSAAAQIAEIAQGNELIITHGNGPQVGLLALQNSAYEAVEPYPLDILDAESQGMIGYLLEQEINNFLKDDRNIVTLLTRVQVSSKDPAFMRPTKPIGPLYSKAEADYLSQNKKWAFCIEADKYRRVVPSPLPEKILITDSILHLISCNSIIIAAGGGGIPVILKNNKYEGVEGVIDKDLTSSLLAEQVAADLFIIATDVDAIYLDWQKPTQYPIQTISPEGLKKIHFAEGSMAPKVKAACRFVEITKKPAIVGSLDHIQDLLNAKSGTLIKYL